MRAVLSASSAPVNTSLSGDKGVFEHDDRMTRRVGAREIHEYGEIYIHYTIITYNGDAGRDDVFGGHRMLTG